MVSQELLNELKTIVKEDYGVILDSKDLTDFANTLISFFELLISINCTKEGGKNE